ncbi:biopolymer transport protein [Thioflavicoccus mobilis 8321]|uniref:Biopolymer transport protein n=1 Tax=Thioflavicoccus mobilis 8321 TaxID=765912 RepID=L0H0R0_9GAMM|nr:biopolymer transporter ExbD [Thioflavicoccus mobilis]AGA91225.1 biopolymer transport protein [Thioflavicoccus mobilis 8321]
MQLEQRTRARRRAAIGLTPLIDVVFILLLFFMLASSLTRLHTVPVVVAGDGSATAAPTTDPGPLLLRVLAAGGLVLDGQAIASEQLPRALAERQALDPALRLAVEAEDAVPLQRLLDVLDAVAQAGVSGVRLQ